jgi:cation-transporting ATPase 13A1
MAKTSDVQHPSSLARATVHTASFVRRAVVGAVFVALYSVAIQWCYNTAGEPLAAAKKELEAKEALLNASGRNGSEILSNSTEDILAELAEIGAEPHHSLLDENGTVINGTTHTKPLPSKYLPNAWAGALLFAVCTLNCLFFLLGYWYVGFKAASLFAPDPAVKEGSSVHVRTQAHKGSDAMCKLRRSCQPPHRLGFEFQRQRYEYVSPQDAERERTQDVDITGLGEGNGYIRHMKCPVDLPLATYHQSKGLTSEEVVAATERFGENTLTVPTPKFLDLYKQQLVSPLVVFQFFTAILWCLDEYWQFVMFQMGMILMLESTTVFQRIKTFGTLNSMSSKPYRLQVFRDRRWQDISSLLLLPGDIISVKTAAVKLSGAAATPAISNGAAGEAQGEKQKPKDALEESTGIVPCDCVLLHGDAVVNEATLTGESVPQMKDAMQAVQGQEETRLDIDGAHRVHMLFSGTQIIASNGPARTGGQSSKADSTDPRRSPDGGCLCYVVRTGFHSSQGTMMQMIECSQHKMQDDSKETAYALLVLLVFALIAAGYVLKKGMEKGDRTTHELLLKCVIIITSTVPKQLPMQMAMAVNTALVFLMKKGVFCTEPFRVPISGKVNVCVFDKTGTLTTDQLVPIGMMNPSGPRKNAVPSKNDMSRSCALKKGDQVTVDGVSSKPELNGRTMKVLSIQSDGRVEVDHNGERLSLKRSSLVASSNGLQDQGPPHGLFPMVEACPEALIVVAGCCRPVQGPLSR